MRLVLSVIFLIFILLVVSCVKQNKPVDDPTILYPFRQNGLLGYIDRQGNTIIEPRFNIFDPDAEEYYLTTGEDFPWLRSKFSEGVAVLGIRDENWICIDKSGKTIFEIECSNMEPFIDGFSLVTKGDDYWFVDRSGKNVFRETYEMALSFSEGVAPVYIGDSVNYIDVKGRKIIRTDYISGGMFIEGLAPFTDDSGMHGYIDVTGNVEIEPSYEYADYFSETLAVVSYNRVNEGYLFIDRNGIVVIELGLKYSEVYPFREGLAIVGKYGKYGYIDTDGEEIVEPIYEFVMPFSEGLAAVKNDSGWGFIDSRGTWVIPPRFKSAESFEDGLAWVGTDEGKGYINMEGNFIWRPEE